MAQNLTYLTTTSELNSVAQAIRIKGGTSDPLEYPQGFIDAIDDIETGGSGVSSITVSGDCQNFMASGANKQMYLELGSPEIIMTNITSLGSAFYNVKSGFSDYSNFKINSFFNPSNVPIQSMFASNTELVKLPTLNASLTCLGNSSSVSLFSGTKITSIPSDWETRLDVTKLKDGTQSCSGWFTDCTCLRSIPSSWLPHLYNNSTSASSSQKMWQNMFYRCYGLNELDGFACPDLTYTNNRFPGFIDQCCSMKTFRFITNNGTPYVRSWTNQILDLSSSVGYFGNGQDGTAAGLPSEKRITDATSYASLKNDPDSWTTNVNYSRFDHASAVALINSLPDTSAVSLPSAPSNTVKFKSASGTDTDAGAISTLTQAEIDVAVNKGWKITLI